MRNTEAKVIARQLGQYGAPLLSPMVEIGSSTLQFRTVTKPHIDKCLHSPLRHSGIEIITTDLKVGIGIDIAGDIYDPQIQELIRSRSPKSLLCCNILEHVEDRGKFAEVCSDLLGPGGLLVVTVPYSFPYHADPIDTLYRPSPQELQELFPDFDVEHSEVIQDNTYWNQLCEKGRVVAFLFVIARFSKNLVWVFNLRKLWRGLNWVFWLWRRFEISFIILRKR